jgi:alpha-D-ribose 1-methylphosphonate 5-triphosphate synthase subunit PhnH
MSSPLSPGFADAVGDAQSCFRLVLDAMAHPGRVHAVRPMPAPAPLGDAAASVVLTLVDHETPVWLDPDAAAARAWIAFHTGAPIVEEPAQAMFAVALSCPALSFMLPASAVMAAVGPACTPCGAGPGTGVNGGPPSTIAAAPSMIVGAPSKTGDATPAEPVPPPSSPTLPIGMDEVPESSATLILLVQSLTTGRRYRLEGPGLREPAVLTADGLPTDFAALWQSNHALFPCGIDLILCAGNQLAALPRSVSVQEA